MVDVRIQYWNIVSLNIVTVNACIWAVYNYSPKSSWCYMHLIQLSLLSTLILITQNCVSHWERFLIPSSDWTNWIPQSSWGQKCAPIDVGGWIYYVLTYWLYLLLLLCWSMYVKHTILLLHISSLVLAPSRVSLTPGLHLSGSILYIPTLIKFWLETVYVFGLLIIHTLPNDVFSDCRYIFHSKY